VSTPEVVPGQPPGPEHQGHDPHRPPGHGRYELGFEPNLRRVRVPAGVTLFDAASWNGIAIDSTCGGHGTCKKCRVRVLEGDAHPSALDTQAFSDAELSGGWRLACRVEVAGDLRVEVPPLVTRPKAATLGVGRKVILRPAVQKRYVELVEPSLDDQCSDLERLLGELEDLELQTDLEVLRKLGGVLRQSGFKATAVIVDTSLIDVEPGDTTSDAYGIAFDLGTTTVVATLLDLSAGAPLAVDSLLNKQQPFGADVITRISATMIDPEARERLKLLAHETLDELAQSVCRAAGIDPSTVYEIALAGNATMTHIALGIDAEPLGVAPFTLATRSYPELLAADLGVMAHPRARATVFPAFGAYVGGDINAGLIASGMDRDSRTRLFIDVGTNCEIVLNSGDHLIATAAPAGPAFEGGAIRCGMRAAAGAIEGVALSEQGLVLKVIGDTEPTGLCGSGLVDAVAELVRVGLIDRTGRFVPDETGQRVAPQAALNLGWRGQERVFVLHAPGLDGRDATRRGELDAARRAEEPGCVYLSQRDVRELQFAKAAISTGWRILLQEGGVEVTSLQQVLLAGSFGSYLSPASAIRIGLVPRLPVLRVVSAGNVAGEGAKMALLSIRERAAAVTLLEEVEYVELSNRDDFNDLFIDQLAFPD
jgi:uncharacterized 2Fe-2S/4Fe-4S cluster protein (DUF4445 family)